MSHNRNDGLEEAALYHDERAANCLAVAAVNQGNELGSDCKAYASIHKIAAAEIRAMKRFRRSKSGNDEDYGARGTDPDTSHDAFNSLDTTKLENHVFDPIAKRGPLVGANWTEIHQLTGIPMQSISPRLAPLRRKNRIKALVVDGQVVKRPGHSGRGQIVWVAV